MRALIILLSLWCFLPAQSRAEDRFVRKTMRRMTLDQKIGQLMMVSWNADFQPVHADNYRDVLDAVKMYQVGGLIVFGGSAYSIAVQVNEFQRMAKLPLLIGADLERGLYQQLPDGVHFPPNMAVAATGNSRYAEQQGEITGREARSVGINMVFAPVLDVNNNPLNPIINYRSYGESPLVVSRMGSAFIKGLQSQNVIATAKHFPGHGDTSVDSHTDLPVLNFTRDRLDTLEFVPFKDAIENKVAAIMTAHIAIPSLTDSLYIPATLSKPILTDILRNEMNFSNLIISDAFNMRALNPEGFSRRSIIDAVNAGVDIILMPVNVRFTHRTIKRALRLGQIDRKHIDQSVERILRAKYRIGLFRQRYVNVSEIKTRVEATDAKQVSERIARGAVSWLRRDRFPVDFSRDTRILNLSVSSERTLENPGRTFYRRLKRLFPATERMVVDHRTDSLSLVRLAPQAQEYEMIVVSIYSRSRLNEDGGIGVAERERQMVERILRWFNGPVLAVTFASPYVASGFDFIPDHLVAYSYSGLMQRTTANLISDLRRVRGTPPVTVPGINQTVKLRPTSIVDEQIPEYRAVQTAPIDSLFQAAIADSVFPGAAFAIGNRNGILMQKAYGRQTYESTSPRVTVQTRYDLASLTKVMATTMAIMRLVDRNQLTLNTKLGDILNEFADTDKANITIGQLLTHTSGMLWHKNFFQTIKTPDEMRTAIRLEPLVSKPGEDTKYSDLGFITLMFVIEEVSGKPFAEYLNDEIYRPLQLKATGFTPPKSEWARIPPTEAVPWRGKLAQGEVHDENAMAMGGVSGHAGLFSNVGDLSRIAMLLLNNGVINGTTLFSERTVRQFTQPARIDPRSRRAFGWDKPSPISMTGIHFTDASYGHSGFTGTTIWIDPSQDVFVILLTNRVYPTRENRKIGRFRPAFHDIVMEAFGYRKVRKSYLEHIQNRKKSGN